MKSFLLDSNVLSEIWKPLPSSGVLSWLEQAEWFLPVPVIAEIQEGAEATASTTRRAQINARLDEFLSLHSALVIDWDAETARMWARLKHSPEVKRRPQPLWDSLLDAMAVRHNAIVATRNRRDFRHAETFSPWEYNFPINQP
ncbi:MAG TPA: PIN domain-containing protein [Verrucomicrobiae bacterium]|jgi:predicted nucleic acid-binding protein|nr:PIN domain-containing protein [Verrucomicrobiae bacterium]